MGANLGQRLVAQLLHELLHALQAGNTRHNDRNGLFAVAAVLFVHLFHCVVQGLALGAVVSRHLGDQHGSGNGILVAGIIAAQVAVGFFKRENVLVRAVLLELLDLLGKELEAGEGIKARNAVLFSRRACHLGGNDGFEHRRMCRHGVRQLLCGDDVIGEQHTDLVAGQGDILAGLVLEDDAGAVGVRVGADDQINIVLLCQLDGERKAFLVLRIRVLNGREVAVDLHLLRLTDNVLVAQAAQDLGNQTVAGTVERRVHQLELIGNLLYAVRIYRNLNNLAEVSLVGLLRQNTDQTVFDGLIVVCSFYTGEDIGLCHFVGNHVCLGRRKLCAVLPVNLVAVVLLRVVGSRDVDACDAAVVTDSEGQLRGRTQLIEQQRLDAVCGHDARRLLGELGREMAGVVCNGNTAVHCGLTIRYDQVCQTLCSLTDGKAVHAVEADAQYTAQTGRAERQRRKETAFDLFLIICNSSQLGMLVRREGRAVQPTLVFRHIIHWYHLIVLVGASPLSADGLPLSKLYNIRLSMQGVLREFVKRFHEAE